MFTDYNQTCGSLARVLFQQETKNKVLNETSEVTSKVTT